MRLASLPFAMMAMTVFPTSISFEFLVSRSSFMPHCRFPHTNLNRASRYTALTRLLLAPKSIFGSGISSANSRSCSSTSQDKQSSSVEPAQKMIRTSSAGLRRCLIDLDENGTELTRRFKGRGRVPAGYVEQPDGNWIRTVRTSPSSGSVQAVGAQAAAATEKRALAFADPTALDDPAEAAENDRPVLRASSPRSPSPGAAHQGSWPPPPNAPPLDPGPWQPDRLPASWVVFSDLHVSRASLAVCLNVLAAVRAEAERRRAGIIFLGDFWQDRGSLRIEPLNAGASAGPPAAARFALARMEAARAAPRPPCAPAAPHRFASLRPGGSAPHAHTIPPPRRRRGAAGAGLAELCPRRRGAVLEALSQWRGIPVIAIPGNHDQARPPSPICTARRPRVRRLDAGRRTAGGSRHNNGLLPPSLPPPSLPFPSFLPSLPPSPSLFLSLRARARARA